MNRLFDPEAIKAQIANLVADRERIDRAVEQLQAALRNVEGAGTGQSEFSIDLKASDTTLYDAVKRACIAMVDGITRQRVISHVEREHPFLKPKSPSVAASLINLTKGDHPMLRVAIEGKGRSPSFYSTQNTLVIQLSGDEIKGLFDENATKGTGGWQSLWLALQKNFDKASGSIKLSPELRARIYHYYHSYGQGGWQDKVKRVFRRELPHLFAS
jgi:hypothetical protein